MPESDLYAPVKRLFEQNGYEVKSEILDCDLVARKNDICVVAELKLRVNLDVILQAVDRQRLTPYVYIAVPVKRRERRDKKLRLLLRRLELGLIEVDTRTEQAQAILEPRPFDFDKSARGSRARKEAVTREFAARLGDRNIGGTTGQKRMTAYKQRVLVTAALLARHGPCAPRDLVKAGGDKKLYSILQKNYYGWFGHPAKGQYDLTDKGRAALVEHEGLVGELMGEIKAC